MWPCRTLFLFFHCFVFVVDDIVLCLNSADLVHWVQSAQFSNYSIFASFTFYISQDSQFNILESPADILSPADPGSSLEWKLSVRSTISTRYIGPGAKILFELVHTFSWNMILASMLKYVIRKPEGQGAPPPPPPLRRSKSHERPQQVSNISNPHTSRDLSSLIFVWNRNKVHFQTILKSMTCLAWMWKAALM